MAIAYWWLTIVLLAAAVAVGLIAWRTARRHRVGRTVPVGHTRRLTDLPAFRRALGRSTGLVSVAAGVLVVLLVVTSITAGRWVYQRIETPEKYNRDIVLCLDVSGSMIDYDVQVIDRYLEMIPGFSGERMSLVLWDSTAAQVFPLTDDYTFVEEQLKTARNGMLGGDGSYWYGTRNGPGASLIGDGLASCALMFDGEVDDGRSRSIILATDNAVNGSPIITLPDAAKLAEQKNIRVYGLDANTFEDAYADEYRTSVEQHDGQYFKLTDPGSVPGIVDQITSDQTSIMQGAPQILITDRPGSWLIAMLVGLTALLLLAWRARL